MSVGYPIGKMILNYELKNQQVHLKYNHPAKLFPVLCFRLMVEFLKLQYSVDVGW